MKYLNKIIAGALLVICGACTDSFEDINTDPNEPVEIPAVNLFTQGQFSLANRIWGRALNFEFGMLMVQHFSQNEYADESRYNFTNSSFSTPWRNMYATNGGIVDLIEAMRLTEADESISDAVKANRLAQLTILKVLGVQTITDIWGAVPYSQAFKPDEFSSPAYDEQQAIYTSLIDELNGAISSLNMDEAGFTSGDVLFGGDMEMWGIFANSLKIRLGMRIADVSPELAATTVSSAFSSPIGVISSNEENVLFVFGSDQRIANPFYVDAITRDDFCVSTILVERMEDHHDPRISAYAAQNSFGEIVGLPYGLTDAAATALKPTTSRPHSSILEATAPAKLITYAEIEFFRAEAIEREMITGDPAVAYTNAVTASMSDWGISSGDIVTYLAENSYNPASWESVIGYEKWVGLYTQGLEAWAERRRLNEPSLPLPSEAVSAVTAIPVRALYPASEQEANSANLNAVNPGNMITNVWWDVD